LSGVTSFGPIADVVAAVVDDADDGDAVVVAVVCGPPVVAEAVVDVVEAGREVVDAPVVVLDAVDEDDDDDAPLLLLPVVNGLGVGTAVGAGVGAGVAVGMGVGMAVGRVPGWKMLTLNETEHPLLSVTVIVYAPAGKLFAVSVVSWLGVDHVILYGDVPPETRTVAEPSCVPATVTFLFTTTSAYN